MTTPGIRFKAKLEIRRNVQVIDVYYHLTDCLATGRNGMPVYSVFANICDADVWPRMSSVYLVLLVSYLVGLLKNL